MRYVAKLDNGLYVDNVDIHYGEVSCGMATFENAFIFNDLDHVNHFIELFGGKDRIEVYDFDSRETHHLKIVDVLPVFIQLIEHA